MGRVFCSLWIMAVAGVSVAGEAGSAWPQWGGPGRDFQIASASLATSWPEAGPKVVWSRSLGEGYSALVTDGTVLFTMYRDGDDEVVVALDAATGETRWRHSYRAPFPSNPGGEFWKTSAGPGPYSTPLLAAERLFSVGVGGQLHALNMHGSVPGPGRLASHVPGRGW